MAAGAGADGAVGAPATTTTTSGIEADVVDTVPKTMQGKARRLMERLKRNMTWTARGELIHEGVPVAGMTFLLTVIDVFSKVAWCVPMKNKSAASLVAALDSTFSRGWPKTLQEDQGLEFLNKSVQALLKKHGIHHFSTHNAETKASVVERFNRTLKTRMWRYFTKHQTWRYIDVLQDLV